ncbi:MAG: helix-turn-helix transcriptional regulator [Epulopiscium sp.]|nr:helix-turn-helix transcriptional regulator [Candidatus Epulonipiscium sp.]
MKNNAVGERIKKLCEMKGITVNALAVKSKVPPSTLKNIIYGHVENAGIETISKLCEGLEITIQEFFSDDNFN